MRIITISREFGSGGRELGKRLADKLGFAYYDREIIDAIATKSNLDKNYVESVLQNFNFTFGKTLSLSPTLLKSTVDILVAERNVIKEFATQKDCVIVGRGADIILKEFNPFNIFVYADVQSKIARCKNRALENEHLSDKQLIKEFTQIDKARAKHYALLSGTKWGEKENYHLCINTTDLQIPELTAILTQYVKFYLEQNNI